MVQFYKVSGDSSLAGLTLGAVYHDFNADIGGDYSTEIDLSAKKLWEALLQVFEICE